MRTDSTPGPESSVPSIEPDRGPTRREWMILVALLIAFGILAGVGVAWLDVGLAYVLAVVFPGTAALAALTRRLNGRPVSFLEGALYANLLGATLVMAVGWTAARLGLFSSIAVLLLTATVGVVLALAERRTLVVRARRAIARASWDQFGFLLGLLASAALLLLPAFLLLRTGAQIGGDTSFFSRIGDVLAQTGHWPDLSSVWQPYTSQADLAPGLPVLYGTFGPVLGVPSLHLAVASNVLVLAFAGLAMFLLLREFVGPRWIAYAGAFCWMVSFPDNTAIVNDLFSAGLPGFYPDAVASISFFLVVVTIVVRLVREPGRGSDQVALLAALFLGIVLLNQLSFLMAGILLVVAGVYLLVRAGPGWTLKAAAAVLVPVLLFLPEYLIPSNALADTPSVEAGHGIRLATFLDWAGLGSYYLAFGRLGLIGAAVAAAGAVFAVLWRLTQRTVTPLWDTRGLLLLGVVAVLYLPLAFTPLGYTLLGIGASRFHTYLGMLSVPFVAVALVSAAGCVRWALIRLRARGATQRIAVPRLGHTRSIVATGLVVAVFVAAAGQGVVLNLQNEANDLRPGLTFNSYMMGAAEWLADHGARDAVVAADGNSGNSGLTVLAVYSDHVVIFRPDFDLYITLTQSPYPSNLPVALTNTVMTDPNATNAEAAYEKLDVQYYIFQWGYSNKIINAFSLLAYFPIVYSNAEVVVFQFVPSLMGDAQFLPATDYASGGVLLTTTEVETAFNASNSVPLTPNAISSTGPYGAAFNGTQVNYTFTVDPGIYTLSVDRYVYQTSEHIEVQLNGRSVGTIYFTTTGWTLGTLPNLVLSPGHSTLTFTFEGTVGYMDPIDYLTVSQG
jgi:hypothetical protein